MESMREATDGCNSTTHIFPLVVILFDIYIA
jgi:hypothetical protein